MGFEEFFMLSAFFGHLKITAYMRKKQSPAPSFTVTDYAKIYTQRFLRLAPPYYLVFFTGWLIGPYLNTGQWWYTY